MKRLFLKVRKVKGSILFKISPLFQQFSFLFQGCSTLEKVGTVWMSQHESGQIHEGKHLTKTST